MTGVNWNLDLSVFLRAAGLTLQSIEPVNFGRVSSVVLCRRILPADGSHPTAVDVDGADRVDGRPAAGPCSACRAD